MKTENWKIVKELLQEVLPLDPSERTKFLRNSGIGNEIRSEVESLLSFEEESEDLMCLSAFEFSKDFFDIEDDSKNVLIGEKIGAYQIVRELGYGGMGSVFLAERADGKFEQKVALKLLKREMNTAALRRRFRQEREILASLEHPNIARLLDAGTTEDKIPYIAMEYVEGVPVDEYCNKNKLGLPERLDLFVKICSAVNFAHRNLIVHRDLKPSNILVTESGAPKLLDFGISKILSAEFEFSDSATVTKLGMMTPSYASPEQLQSKSVTTATDIYSLGVILYELLSGHRPFEAKEANLKDIYKAVLETEPLPPSLMIAAASKSFKEITEAKTEWKDEFSDVETRKYSETEPSKIRHTIPNTVNLSSNSLRGDLDNIVLKALRKEPERRYLSAENFSEDIVRHLKGLPVTARPNTLSYRAVKFFNRNKASVIASGFIFLAIIGGIVATLWQTRVARAERMNAEKRFNEVRALANSFLFEFSPLIENLPGSTPARELLVKRALEYLDNLSQETGGDAELRRELAAAYEKVGDVQGNPYNPNLGDIKGALESYEKSKNIRRELLEKNPEDLRARDELASVLKRIADTQSNGGEYLKAAELYDQALGLREKIVERIPKDFDAREKLAGLYRSRGLIPFYEGDNKKAIEYYQRSQAIAASLLKEQPDNPKIIDSYAYMFIMIGEAQGWDNDSEGAAKNLQTGLDMLIPLGEKYPTDLSIQRTVMLAYQKTAEIRQDLKEFDKSVELFVKALEISQYSLRADPHSFQAKRDVAMAYKKLAQAQDDAGNSLESVKNLGLALNLFSEMSRADPNNTEYPYDVANTRFSIGETYLTLKDYESARQAFLTAKEEFRTVLATNPGNIYAVRMSSYNLHRLGKCYAALFERSKTPDLAQNALENFRAGFANLNNLKSEGKLGEYDFEELDKIEKDIQTLENKSRN